MSARWLQARVLITVGTGGVGKTTLSAAIGLEGARRGRRTLVLTIDPARRLADALGLPRLDHEPRRVPDPVLRAAGVAGKGELWAMMLDTKRTFDEVVQRYAPDADSRERIFANPIYQHLTDALAGSREYSAMEKLHQLHTAGGWDLIVLDTPPARHALEFLEAPRRLTGFLEGRFLRLLVHPAAAVGRTSFRLFRMGSALALRAMERVTGLEFLSSVSEFLLAFEAMLGGFVGRAHEIEELLRDPATGFVLVAGPDAEQARRAEQFWHRLAQERIHLLGIVINRVHPWPGGGEPPDPTEEARGEAVEALAKRLAERAGRSVAEADARALVAAAARQAALARRDAGTRRRLERALALAPELLRTIPLFEEDVRALEALGRMAARVFGEVDRGG